MVVRRALLRLAAGARVPVFAVAGAGAREAVQDLRLRDELRLVDTPRAANVLLVAGAVPESLAEPLARVHDAMSHPRGTVWWPLGAARGDVLGPFPEPVLVDHDVVETLVSVHRELLTGSRRSDPSILPDVEPAPWRGVGPYGQGGSGMTGGTPYGRPMAQVAPDRDGLRLDVLPLRVGPLFPTFPPGLVLSVKMAGDVVVEGAIAPNPFAGDRQSGSRPGLRPFLRAVVEPVPVAELELARARAHLRWLADALAAHQLASLGSRVLGLAAQVAPGEGAVVRGLARWLGWSQVFRWSTGGVGRLTGEQLAGRGAGPVARAAGLAEDVRIDDPAYRELGFEPVVQAGGDSAARWRQRLAEAAQSLDLAALAGSRRTQPTGRVESPRGRLEAGSAATGRLLPQVPGLLEGLEWGDAVTSLLSLDLDLEEAAAAEQLVGEPVAR